MTTADPLPAPAIRIRAVQLVVLLLLGAAVFWPVLGSLLRDATRNPEAAHMFAAPVAIGLLIWLRRRALAESLGRPSLWGIALILAGLVTLVGATWPFNYGTIRGLALVPVAAGAVLAVGGWRTLFVSLPMLAVLTISIPTGARVYASLIIRPEELTLEAARGILDLLPGIIVDRRGLDLSFIAGDTEGAIALGVSNRGASMFLGYLLIGLFVTFARRRPAWQWIVMGLAVVPVLLVCNLVRVVSWGLITIYGGAAAASSMPRFASTLISFVLAYLICVGLLWVINRFVTEMEGEPAPGIGDSS
ncbi:MAG: exosortase/archaeosortase family protein [Planctomycetota bacterium]|jgi:exosortase/archaeosortase family protein